MVRIFLTNSLNNFVISQKTIVFDRVAPNWLIVAKQMAETLKSIESRENEQDSIERTTIDRRSTSTNTNRAVIGNLLAFVSIWPPSLLIVQLLVRILFLNCHEMKLKLIWKKNFRSRPSCKSEKFLIVHDRQKLEYSWYIDGSSPVPVSTVV